MRTPEVCVDPTSASSGCFERRREGPGASRDHVDAGLARFEPAHTSWLGTHRSRLPDWPGSFRRIPMALRERTSHSAVASADESEPQQTRRASAAIGVNMSKPVTKHRLGWPSLILAAAAALASPAVMADAVCDWNSKAGEIVVSARMGPPPANRAMAIVQYRRLRSRERHHQALSRRRAEAGSRAGRLGRRRGRGGQPHRARQAAAVAAGARSTPPTRRRWRRSPTVPAKTAGIAARRAGRRGGARRRAPTTAHAAAESLSAAHRRPASTCRR